MDDLTRRSFVKSSAGAAAGMTVIGALVAEQADAHDRKAASVPIVAWVKDPHAGKISFMWGAREVTVRDKKLAAQIVRATR